jgi:hypothetical protein
MPLDSARLVRLCLDLNVWVAAFLTKYRDRRAGSSAFLVEAVRSRHSTAGPVQLVVSVGMLERLRIVLIREFAVSSDAAAAVTAGIEVMASTGPAGDHPYLLLGGTGVMPLRDEEDRHVLEVAVAAQADLLATANLSDFAGANFEPLRDWAGATVYRPMVGSALVIAHPDNVAAWLRSGTIPTH